MATETISPESAYASKPNIVAPSAAAGEPRTAASLRDRAVLFGGAAGGLDYQDGPRSVSALGDGKSGTWEADDEVVTITSHGYAVGDVLKVVALTGGTGATLNGLVYVITVPTANTFTVSATPGGSVLAISADATAVTFVKVGNAGDRAAVGTPQVVLYGSPTKEA